MSLKSAYGAGKRAGRAEPVFLVANGLKYPVTPQCPFTPLQCLRYALWHEGFYNGTIQRLTMKGGKIR